MNFRRKKREKLDITLISMIDVLFVLLLFFMVSTTFNQHSQVKITLPEADGAESEETPKMVTLTIDADGLYYLEGADNLPHELVDQNKEGLKRALLRLTDVDKALPFIINADDNTPTKAVITALDIATQVGFSHATFTTNKPKDAP